MRLKINRANLKIMYLARVLNISNVMHLFEIEADRGVFGSAAAMDQFSSSQHSGENVLLGDRALQNVALDLPSHPPHQHPQQLLPLLFTGKRKLL